MATQTIEYDMEYGIKSKKEDEKQIVKNINNFLKNEYNYRKMYKWKDTSISKFNYGDYYCQFIKEKPRWYFDLTMNEDLDGKWKFDNREAQWILYTRKNYVEEYTQKDHEDVDLFFKKLVEAIGFEAVLLHKYKLGEERIGNK
ncbi:MAG: hypothetical protein LBO72_02710 [Helicobacteraceae bacterium]|jgi:hypothetical protein|nr:hypothetical protein [Helicobacteraceae bacterium]